VRAISNPLTHHDLHYSILLGSSQPLEPCQIILVLHKLCYHLSRTSLLRLEHVFKPPTGPLPPFFQPQHPFLIHININPSRLYPSASINIHHRQSASKNVYQRLSPDSSSMKHQSKMVSHPLNNKFEYPWPPFPPTLSHTEHYIRAQWFPYSKLVHGESDAAMTLSGCCVHPRNHSAYIY
jgi:hypothetical protein